MATKHRTTSQRRSPRHVSTLSSLVERQLDAYLQTRDTLRRLRALSALTGDVKHRPPSGAPASPV